MKKILCMKNWDHSIHQHVQKFECTKLELFCFIFVEVIKKFMGSVFFFFFFFLHHPIVTEKWFFMSTFANV